MTEISVDGVCDTMNRAYLMTAMFTGAEAVASYIGYMVDWGKDVLVP